MKFTIPPRMRTFVVACISSIAIFGGTVATAQHADTLTEYAIAEFGHPPAIPDGLLNEDVQRALNRVLRISFDQNRWDSSDTADLELIAASGDPRLAWTLTDILRFIWNPEFGDALNDTTTTLLNIEVNAVNKAPEILDHLIAWNMPAYPGYLDAKRAVFTNYLDGWDRIFVEGDIDWQLVQWGGVNIDDRPYNTTDDVCNCIPAADNPPVTSAEDATWLTDDTVVFGIEVNGEYRAYPRRIMEVREMVNDTLGGRDLGIPYCTLCGAAQAYFTDQLPAGVERPILRTSGLLIRSNKVMYDLVTDSIFDTFLGHAVTGPLAEKGV